MQAETPAANPVSGAKPRARIRGFRELGIMIAIVLMVAIIQHGSRNFLGSYNLSNLAVQFSMFGLLSIGETLVILTAGIDLSIGALTTFSGVIGALLVTKGHLPTAYAIVAVLLMGVLIGLFHAFFIVKLGITPFIVTLASLSIFEGLTLYVTQGFPVVSLPSAFTWLGGNNLFHIPVPFWVLTLVFALLWFLMYRMPLGRYIFAVGGNATASRLSGVKVEQVLVFVYVMSAVIACLVGVILTGWLGEGQPGAAHGWELQAIAASIIGGTSLFGGVGSLLGALLGAVFISTLSDGMVLLNVNAYAQELSLGLVILAAVVFDLWQTKRFRTRERG